MESHSFENFSSLGLSFKIKKIKKQTLKDFVGKQDFYLFMSERIF